MKKIIVLVTLFYIGQTAKGQITIEPKHFSTDTLPTLNSLSQPEQKQVVNLRNAHYFSETISTFIPLSKVSFWLNKRFTGNDFTDRKNSIIDAYVNTYIHISSDKWFLSSAKYQWLFSFYFNPNFEVRIFRDDPSKGDYSEPVRTPSFRPGGELFITNSRLFSRSRKHNFSFSYKGYHHSNGQDGIEINPVDRPWGKRGTYNTYNGNFSENFHSEFYLNYYGRSDNNRNFYSLKAAYSVAHGVAFYMKDNDLFGTHSVQLFGSLVHAPEYSFKIKKADGELRPVTGRYNAESVRVEFLLNFVTSKMNTGPVANLQPASFKQRFNVGLAVHRRLPGFAEAGLFAEAGYYGHDTYNVYFQRSAWFLKAGISFGKFVYYKRTDDLK